MLVSTGAGSVAAGAMAGRFARLLDADETLAAARTRAFEVVDGIAAGIFPPRPHDPMMCRYCAYSTVCRKDYVGDE